MNKENHSSTASSWLVWGLADLYFALSVTFAMFLGIVLPSIQKELHLTMAQLGLLGFSFFLSFGFLQFFAGSLIDFKGPKVALALSASIATVGFFLLFNVETFFGAMIAQMILGIGFSISYVGAIYVAEKWFSKEVFPLISGVTQMSANIISAALLFSMGVTGIIGVDFRSIAMNLGGVAFVLALLLFLFVRTPVSSPKEMRRPFLSSHLGQLFRIPQFWFCIFYFGANFGVFLAFSSLWNIPDSIAYGHTLETATKMSSMLRFGGAFGAVISGWLVCRFGRSSVLVKVYSTGALFFSILLIFGPVFQDWVTFFVMALMGFFFGGTALGFPIAAQHIPPNLKGAGFGLMTSFGYLFSAFLEYFIGVILNMFQSPLSAEKFKVALAPLVLFALIGWIASLQLKEKENM